MRLNEFSFQGRPQISFFLPSKGPCENREIYDSLETLFECPASPKKAATPSSLVTHNNITVLNWYNWFNLKLLKVHEAFNMMFYFELNMWTCSLNIHILPIELDSMGCSSFQPSAKAENTFLINTFFWHFLPPRDNSPVVPEPDVKPNKQLGIKIKPVPEKGYTNNLSMGRTLPRKSPKTPKNDPFRLKLCILICIWSFGFYRGGRGGQAWRGALHS